MGNVGQLDWVGKSYVTQRYLFSHPFYKGQKDSVTRTILHSSIQLNWRNSCPLI